MRKPATLLALAIALVTSGCGGGGHSSVLPAPVQPGHPVAQNERVKFTFTVPNKTSTASRRAETISPSTQSIGVAVNSGTEQIFDALPTSPGCSVTESGTTCTVTIDAAVGTDTFVVHAYSGAGGTGAILDSTTFTSTIVIDTTNTLNITLGPVVSTTADSGPGSLRQALDDAKPGDTVTFLLTAPAAITLTSGAVAIAKNVTLSGPVGGTITISGGNASRVLEVLSGVTAAISNLTLTQGNAASGNGGAVDDLGALTLTNVTINNSTVSDPAGFGGGVAVETGGSLAISGSTIDGNSAYKAGGVFESAGASPVTITGTTLSNNTVTDTYAYDDGGALVVNVATTLTNDTVSGNTGSAIAVNAPLTISGGTYSNNTAKGGYGGALYVFNNMSITGATFDGNVAGDPNPVASPPTANGGAIYSDYDITVDNSTFTNNQAVSVGADAYGGAIEFDDGSLTVTNSKFTSNSAGGANAVYGYGGAISDEVNTVTITGSTFTSNQAGGTAASEYGFGGALDINAAYTIDRDTFTGNTALGGTDGIAFGGALYIGGSGTQITNSTFSNNNATSGSVSGTDNGQASGGAVSLRSGGSSVALDGDNFSGNTAVASSYASGGALDSAWPTTMNGGTFSGNTASVGLGQCPAAIGGGAYLDADTAMNGVSVTNNKTTIAATTGSTCLVALARKPLPLPMHRGSRRARGSVTLPPPRPKLRKIDVNSSSSTEYGLGGGIASVAGTFTFTGTVTNNSAATDGGGFYLDNSCSCSNVTISNSTVDSNTVTASPGTQDGGGGIYAGATLTTIVTSTISNNTVSGDTGGADGGGGMYAYQPVQMMNDTVTGNSAQFGGDMYFVQTLALTNVTVMNGTATAATGAGGDIYANSASALTLFGSIIAGGSASAQNNIGGDTQTVTITDNGYNLINTSNFSMSGSAGTDITGNGVDPKLSPLASNGGPTQTMADGVNSRGKDLIPLATCSSNGVTTDQRGNPRGDASDNQCDAGAYEYP